MKQIPEVSIEDVIQMIIENDKEFIKALKKSGVTAEKLEKEIDKLCKLNKGGWLRWFDI